MLDVADEVTHECVSIRVARKPKAVTVIDALPDPSVLRAIPSHIRSDNGPGLVAQAVRDRIRALGSKTARIAPGSPRQPPAAPGRMGAPGRSTPGSATGC